MDYTTNVPVNYWYNDELKKANIRDLSGASHRLAQSLQYNRLSRHLSLLRLVYCSERCDRALVNGLSKNFQSMKI